MKKLHAIESGSCRYAIMDDDHKMVGTLVAKPDVARLMIAAPELLDEVERFYSIAKRENWHDATISVLEKLIAKAKGE